MKKHSVSVGLKKTATLCVLKNGNRFLLLKRAKEPNKNTFTPVGGKLEPFESPYQCAIRETYEETGIQVKTMKYCGLLVETSPTKYNWTNFVYLAEVDFISPPSCDEGELKWIDFKEILKVPAPKTDWYIYQYILNNKVFTFNAFFDESLNLLEMKDEIENKIVYTIS